MLHNNTKFLKSLKLCLEIKEQPINRDEKICLFKILELTQILLHTVPC